LISKYSPVFSSQQKKVFTFFDVLQPRHPAKFVKVSLKNLTPKQVGISTIVAEIERVVAKYKEAQENRSFFTKLWDQIKTVFLDTLAFFGILKKKNLFLLLRVMWEVQYTNIIIHLTK